MEVDPADWSEKDTAADKLYSNSKFVVYSHKQRGCKIIAREFIESWCLTTFDITDEVGDSSSIDSYPSELVVVVMNTHIHW